MLSARHFLVFGLIVALYCLCPWSHTSSDLFGQISDPIQPLLQKKCWKCHAAESKAGGLDLSQWEGILTGSDNGPVLDLENRKASRILQVLSADGEPHMPPMEQLPGEAVELFQRWVNDLPADLVLPEPIATQEVVPLPSGLDIPLAIDYSISRRLASSEVNVAAKCDDREFVRRIYLDLTGCIPTPDQVNDFLGKTDSSKRTQLVDQLLASPEHARHLARSFDVMLMGRKENKRNQRNGIGWYKYLESTFANNRPWNELVREVLLARDGPESQAHRWYLFERDNNYQEIAESISRGFFGVDIACAQCHDHPLADEIKQAHYWGLVAFYKRTTNEKQNGEIVLKESAIGGFDNYANALKGTTDAAVLTFLGSDTIEEARPEDPAKQEDREDLYVSIDGQKIPKFSRRDVFVQQIVEGHPYLAKAMVNRVWGLLMGRGLVHPIEKMDSTNRPSHPELLEWLSLDFENHNYDVRRLIRGIVLSQAYQRRSIPESASVDPALFAHGLLKPLTAEAMRLSLEVALQVEIPENSPAARQWRKLFPEIVPENQISTLKQSLSLSNQPQWNQIVQQAGHQWEGEITPAQIEQLFQRVYVRPVSDDELQQVMQLVRQTPDSPAKTRAQILWAMVTSAEFRFNH